MLRSFTWQNSPLGNNVHFAHYPFYAPNDPVNPQSLFTLAVTVYPTISEVANLAGGVPSSPVVVATLTFNSVNKPPFYLLMREVASVNDGKALAEQALQDFFTSRNLQPLRQPGLSWEVCVSYLWCSP